MGNLAIDAEIGDEPSTARPVPSKNRLKLAIFFHAFLTFSGFAMLMNLPYLTHTHNGLTVQGYSRGAVQSYWRIPELKIGFDFGGQPWDFMGTPTWFVSHTHLDHIAALPVFVARRRMMKMEPPTVYVPSHAIDGIRQMMQAFVRLDRGRLPCELIPASAGDEFQISRELVVSVHPVKHTVPALGYIVWERRRKLKEEYVGLSGDEIREIRLSGIEVSGETRFPRVAYLGDSSATGLDQVPQMYDAEILIMEMTFVAPEHRESEIKRNGHIHLDDVVKRRDRFRNQLVIAGHFSSRYHKRQVISTVKSALPDMLDGRLRLWI